MSRTELRTSEQQWRAGAQQGRRASEHERRMEQRRNDRRRKARGRWISTLLTLIGGL